MMFLTKDAVRLATTGVAVGVACEGWPPLPDLFDRFAQAGGRLLVCPIWFNARKLNEGDLLKNAELGGTVPMGPDVAVDRRRRRDHVQLLIGPLRRAETRAIGRLPAAKQWRRSSTSREVQQQRYPEEAKSAWRVGFNTGAHGSWRATRLARRVSACAPASSRAFATSWDGRPS
jgi:hypothetical protein